MKTLAVVLALAAVWSPVSRAEDTTLPVAEESEMRFLKHFDKKIQALESYTVTFLEPGVARKPAGTDGGNMKLKLMPKKKS